MSELNETIQRKYERLPEDVRTALQSVDLRERIGEIAKKHDLRIDAAGQLENVTVMVLLGMVPIGDYAKNIMKHVGVSQGVANAVVLDANESIFGPVRNSLIALQERERREAVVEEGAFFRGTEPDEESEAGEETPPDRDTLLEEIENEDLPIVATSSFPTAKTLPTPPQTSVPDTTTRERKIVREAAAPEALVEVSAPIDTPAPSATPIQTTEKPSIDPFAGMKEKLTTPVAPKKEVVRVDPYREPTE